MRARSSSAPAVCCRVTSPAQCCVRRFAPCTPAKCGSIAAAHPPSSTCLVKGREPKDRELVKIESLTRREREIVALVTEGLRNKQIAERLFISEATVRNHLTSILDKLELGDRFDLAVYAFRRGMVSYPQPGEASFNLETGRRLG